MLHPLPTNCQYWMTMYLHKILICFHLNNDDILWLWRMIIINPFTIQWYRTPETERISSCRVATAIRSMWITWITIKSYSITRVVICASVIVCSRDGDCSPKVLQLSWIECRSFLLQRFKYAEQCWKGVVLYAECQSLIHWAWGQAQAWYAR